MRKSKPIEMRLLKELYRVDNKFWKTGDTDYLPVRLKMAEAVDERFWSEIAGIVAIVTRKHLPVQAFADALRILGWEVVDDD